MLGKVIPTVVVGIGLSVAVYAASVTCSYSFARDLGSGSSGADVAELQTALLEAGFLTAPAVDGRFGRTTQVALARYQVAQQIEPADGYFGKTTRSRVSLRTVIGVSRSIDFRIMCSPGRLSFLGSFGHTDLEIEGARDGACLLRYGAESENPNASGKLEHSCAVPQRVWTFRLSDEIGIDLSPIERFCQAG